MLLCKQIKFSGDCRRQLITLRLKISSTKTVLIFVNTARTNFEVFSVLINGTAANFFVCSTNHFVIQPKGFADKSTFDVLV